VTEWSETVLGDHVDLLTGYPFKSDEYTSNPGDVRLVSGYNIIQGDLRWDAVNRWPNDKCGGLDRYRLRADDVVLAMDRPWIAAGLKYAWFRPEDLPCLLVQRTARLRGTETLDVMFLRHLIGGPEFELYARRITTGTAVPHISPTDIAAFRFSLPPLPEQRKIAEILTTWDDALALLDRRIDLARQRKQGLMQRLLTGRVRFPEFVESVARQATRFGDLPAGWRYVPIESIAKEVSVKNRKDHEFTVLSCTKYDGLVDSLEYFGRQIFSDNLTTYKIVKRSQFAYATNHLEEGSIGYQNLYDAALISPMYTVFETTSDVDDNFLYRVLKTEKYRHIFEINTNGTVNRRGSIRWDSFKRIKIPLPILPEQRRIAGVLQTCDEEIALLERKRDLTAQQKKGLMQRLLTGRVRVKV
jgi:restriction endonuclease S subunit